MSTARRLQRSAGRRVWRTLISLRDWPSYVWAPLVAFIVLAVPYSLHQANKRAQRQDLVLSAIAETSPVYRKILELLDQGPAPRLKPAPYTEVDAMPTLDFEGFEIISDTRIYDLRGWTELDSAGVGPFAHMRAIVRRKPGAKNNTHLRFQLTTVDNTLSMYCRTQSLSPTLTRMRQADDTYQWQLELDFSRVPVGADTEVIIEGHVASDMRHLTHDEGRFQFSIPISTGMAQIWMLMPVGRNYDFFEISGHPIDDPKRVHTIVPHTKVELPLGSISTFLLVNPAEDYRYECRWNWDDTDEELE